MEKIYHISNDFAENDLESAVIDIINNELAEGEYDFSTFIEDLNTERIFRKIRERNPRFFARDNA